MLPCDDCSHADRSVAAISPLLRAAKRCIALIMTMGWNARLTSTEKVLRILCAVLMLSLGFAHKSFALPPAQPVLDETYRLPDGTFAEICFGHDEGVKVDHGKSDHSGDAILFCEACLLASSILVPVPDGESWLQTEFAWLENGLSVERGVHNDQNLETPKARGPPVLFS